MLAAQIQNLPPTPTPPPAEVVAKKKKRRVGGGWPHEPTDAEPDYSHLELDPEYAAEVELGALVKEAQEQISYLADAISVEVDDLDTEVVVESAHVSRSTASAPRPAVGEDDWDDDT